MSWSYDAANLGSSTAVGRLNSVRLLVGDTNSSDQQVQDEEITFALSESSDNVYSAASWISGTISSKLSRKVDTELDGALKAKYSQSAERYRKLSMDLKVEALRRSGTGLGVAVGGVLKTTMTVNKNNTNRVEPSFTSGQFSNTNADDDTEAENGYYY